MNDQQSSAMRAAALLRGRDGPARAGPRTAVILQSSYLPWRGTFDQMNSADVFVLFDTVQYTKRDWRNRNRIVSRNGPFWLTIPVRTKGRYTQSIDDVEISDPAWAEGHWRAIANAYAKAPFFPAYRDRLAALYDRLGRETRLSAINALSLAFLADALGIRTPMVRARDLVGAPVPDDAGADPDVTRNRRLIEICRAVGAERYVSGPAALVYLRPDLFAEAGIEIEIARYPAYRPYPQLCEAAGERVSTLDLLMMTGPTAPAYLQSFSDDNDFLAPVEDALALARAS